MLFIIGILLNRLIIVYLPDETIFKPGKAALQQKKSEIFPDFFCCDQGNDYGGLFFNIAK